MAKKAATKAEKVAKEVVKRARSTKQTDEPSHQSTPSEAFRAIELKSVSGGILTHEPVVFSQDSSQFYLSKDSAVAVYNVQNGEMVQNFSGGAQAEKVLAIFADADNHVYTFSADERVRLWDADTGALVKEWEVPGKIRHVVRDPKLERGFLAVIVRPKYTDAQNNTVKARAMVVRVRLEEDGRVEVEDLVQATSGANRIAVHPEGQWVAVYSNFKVQLLQLSANRVVSHKWAMGERISDIAFHPSEPVLAVGDWRGRIMFWYCLDDSLREDTEERDIVRRPYHWHAHKVNTIAFTEAGTSMLSGGEEGVVVFWQLATDHKSFLPRLGAEIVSIVVSPDQMYYSVTLKDNTVRIYSALDRALVSTLQGLKFAERAALANVKREHAAIVQRLEDDPFTSGLVVHPSTHHLVLNGEPGFLQVFNHLTDRHVSSIEVASFNRIGGASSAIRSVQPHVDLVQFSSDGAWMATVDSRCSNAAYGPRHVTESYLKFWRLDPSTQQYKLVTRVDNPHTHGVRAIAFQPMLRRSGQQPGLLCVSTGRDAMFRVWELQTLENAEEMWTCRAYAKYRGQQPRGCAFSCDGSILAVTFGGAVTLWDAHTVTAPVGTLMARAASPNLSGVAFIGQTNFLASWSEDRVDVWNMLTGSLWWTQVAPVMSVFVHARHALLAMAVRPITNRDETSILVCAPESPVPLVTVRQRGVVAAVALVPAASSGKSGRSHPDTEHGQLKPDPLAHNSLAILTAAGRLNVYAAESDTLAFKHTKDTPLGSEKAGAAARTMDSKVFSSIFGKSKPRTSSADSLDASAATNPHVRNAMRLVRSAVHSAYVNAPHHVLPPVSALFDQFVTQQLAKVSIRDTEEKREEESRDAEMVGEEGGEENGGDAEGPRATTKAPFLKSLRRGFQASQ